MPTLRRGEKERDDEIYDKNEEDLSKPQPLSPALFESFFGLLNIYSLEYFCKKKKKKSL